MPGFVSLLECANHYGPLCLAVPPGLYLSLAVVAATLLGWRFALRNRDRLLRCARWTFGFGALMAATSFLVIVWFFIYDPDSPLGVEDNALVWSIWRLMTEAFGFGFVLIAAALGLRVGALFAGYSGSKLE